jgi:putative transposase
LLSNYDRRRHSVTKLCVHLVFTTKYRRKVMTPEILDEMKTTLKETAVKLGCTPLEINGEADHVHLLLRFPADSSVSSLVNSLKTVSSRMIRKNHPDILHGGRTGLFWSRSYFAATAGGVTLEVLKTYVEKQGTKGRHSSPPSEGEGS